MEITTRKGVVIGTADDADQDIVKPLAWTCWNGYISTMVQSRHVYLHILIMERMIGRKMRKGELVDHKDENPSNNKRANLRVATKSQNMSNRGITKRNTSGYKGVSRVANRSKWQATIQVNYKSMSLGRYDTPEEAALAYNKASTKYFGEFAKLNQL